MKIYDCFPFFNELDLLEIRLNYLDSVVDYFVICESNVTFSGKSKKLFYGENKDLFKRFQHKIIHVIVDDTPQELIGVDPFRTDQHQRNSVIRGLDNCSDEDIIITSDLDEFPDINKIKNIKEFYEPNVLFHFAQGMYYYYFNLRETSGKLLSHSGEFDGIKNKKWLGTKLCNYGFLKKHGVDKLRHPVMREPGRRIADGGWHFTYVGGHKKTTASQRVLLKIECAAHQEFNNSFYKLRVKENINNHKDVFFRDSNFEIVELSDNFPAYIIENKEKFKHLIKEENKK
jgi:beta-1,4-mannosyl-glycoprotein beta-1,4-N-acetylglucosaminyltransferase